MCVKYVFMTALRIPDSQSLEHNKLCLSKELGGT